MERLVEIGEWCLNHWGTCTFVLACIIQITPVFKWNPISALLKWIGKAVNSELKEEIKAIKNKQEEQRRTINENEIDRIRFEVLDFANSCRNGRFHTKDEYEHIIVLNSKYHKLLSLTGDTNGVFDAEYDYIYEIYKQSQRDNTFL